MKIVLLFVLLCFFSGCSRIANIASTTAGTTTEQTGDPVYDTQSEMRVLLPWTWVL